ncbi:MFS transporter [Paenibacillus sp. MMS20-IR301]|nr:MFS transporter [Paenibacillus sp. MMS20-IR301]WNS43699.1 MFS transporter [Paenibacillus sp. MMS20-IR301]
MLNLFIALLGQGMVIPILPDYLKQFNAAGTAAGYLVAAFGVAQFLFSPIGGQLSDRLGRKRLIMAGLALTVISDLLFALSHTLTLLYIARFIGGMGLGLMVPSVMAYVADTTTPAARAKGMGYLSAAMNLGMVLGPGLGGIIAQFGVRAPYFFASGLGLLATLLTIFMPESLPASQRQLSRKQEKSEPVMNRIISSFRTSYFRYLLLILVMTFGLINYETVYALFVQQKYGFNAGVISIIITAGAIVGIIVQVWLLDKIVKLLGEITLIRWSLIMAGIMLLLMLFKFNFAYLLAVSVLFFTFTSFLRPTVNTLISDAAGERQGYASGLANTYSSAGTILGPVLAGSLFDKHIDLPYILGAVILLATVSITLNNRTTAGNERTAAHD